MSRILFMIHGMGVHGTDWAAPVREKLNEAASRYKAFSGAAAFGEQVQLVPVSYHAVFDDLLKGWRNSVGEVEGFASASGIAIPDLGWLAGASDAERSFFWSHLADVLLYRFFPQIAVQVRLRVMQQIVETIVRAKSDPSDPVECSVMAHGLGTAVAHDSLAHLGTYPLDGSRAFLAENGPQFLNLFMIANASRALETTPSVYESIVHPATVRPESAYVHRYFNVGHNFDPCTLVRPFNPENWGRDYRDITGLNHLRDFTVHSYEHYLDAPQVHIPIINALLGPVIPRDEREAAIAAYAAQPGPPCVDEVGRFIQEAGNIAELAREHGDAGQFIVAGVRFLALAEEARNACR